MQGKLGLILRGLSEEAIFLGHSSLFSGSPSIFFLSSDGYFVMDHSGGSGRSVFFLADRDYDGSHPGFPLKLPPLDNVECVCLLDRLECFPDSLSLQWCGWLPVSSLQCLGSGGRVSCWTTFPLGFGLVGGV